MSKIYCSPKMIVVTLMQKDGIMDITSAGFDPNTTTSSQLVKGDNASTSTSSYNVWDDDWSE